MPLFRALLLLALACPIAAQAQEARFVSSLTWEMENTEGFGGFSSIEVAANGRDFYAATDRGNLAIGTLTRTNGTLSDITATLTPLRNEDGRALPTFRSDSEGLALRDDGRIFISFERYHRVWTYSAPDSEPAWLPRHPDFRTMQINSSLESLAIGPDGALYTMPERSGRRTTPFPVYRYRSGTWDIPFTIPRRAAHLITGADIFEDHLYILERDFTGFGFRSRVRRFDLAGGSEETLLSTGTFTHDNLEGLAVWRDAAGDIRLTMISDDNFRAIQKTEIVEYVLR